MADQIDLETTIEDAVNDAQTPEPEPSYSETTPDTDGLSTPATETTEAPVEEASSSQVPAPGSAQSDDSPVDDFGKRFGLQGTSVTGRENRIPYSRVKKIVERAEKEAAEKVRKEVGSVEQPKFAELETKVKDYEGRLQNVAQFEQMIEHRPQDFLNFLSTLPAYKEFFAYISTLESQPKQPVEEKPYLDTATMPQPDETLSDGSKVYSLQGLAKRDEWLAKQVEARALKAAEESLAKRYAPIEEQWKAEQRRQQAIPQIQKQIAEARQWPHFTEIEADIVAILKENQNISLEGAYRQVFASKVLPNLQTNRDEMRKSILEELRKKPTATAAPVAPTKPGTPHAGKRSLEDIIKEAADSLKR